MLASQGMAVPLRVAPLAQKQITVLPALPLLAVASPAAAGPMTCATASTAASTDAAATATTVHREVFELEEWEERVELRNCSGAAAVGWLRLAVQPIWAGSSRPPPPVCIFDSAEGQQSHAAAAALPDAVSDAVVDALDPRTATEPLRLGEGFAAGAGALVAPEAHVALPLVFTALPGMQAVALSVTYGTADRGQRGRPGGGAVRRLEIRWDLTVARPAQVTACKVSASPKGWVGTCGGRQRRGSEGNSSCWCWFVVGGWTRLGWAAAAATVATAAVATVCHRGCCCCCYCLPACLSACLLAPLLLLLLPLLPRCCSAVRRRWPVATRRTRRAASCWKCRAACPAA